MARKHRSAKSRTASPDAIGERRPAEAPSGVPSGDRLRTWRDLAGMPKSDGPARSVEEMNAAVAKEVRRRHERGRY